MIIIIRLIIIIFIIILIIVIIPTDRTISEDSMHLNVNLIFNDFLIFN